ncbi:MAG: IPT/TIG domain-containing protein [Lentisphaeria bacterium]|nr:IPT/TIG domain-containing protein [Lentisphaeria bacterium]
MMYSGLGRRGTGALLTLVLTLGPFTAGAAHAGGGKAHGDVAASPAGATGKVSPGVPYVKKVKVAGVEGLLVSLTVTAAPSATHYAAMDGAWDAAQAVWHGISDASAAGRDQQFAAVCPLAPSVGRHEVAVAVLDSSLGTVSAPRTVKVSLAGPFVKSVKLQELAGLEATFAITASASATHVALMEGHWDEAGAAWVPIHAKGGQPVITFAGGLTLPPVVGARTVFVAVRDEVLGLTSLPKSCTVKLSGPKLKKIDPSNGQFVGHTVTIDGQGFGAMGGTGACGVTFAGVPAIEITEWSDGRITCVVPDDAASGEVCVMTESGLAACKPYVVYASPAGLWDIVFTGSGEQFLLQLPVFREGETYYALLDGCQFCVLGASSGVLRGTMYEFTDDRDWVAGGGGDVYVEDTFSLNLAFDADTTARFTGSAKGDGSYALEGVRNSAEALPDSWPRSQVALEYGFWNHDTTANTSSVECLVIMRAATAGMVGLVDNGAKVIHAFSLEHPVGLPADLPLTVWYADYWLDVGLRPGDAGCSVTFADGPTLFQTLPVPVTPAPEAFLRNPLPDAAVAPGQDLTVRYETSGAGLLPGPYLVGLEIAEVQGYDWEDVLEYPEGGRGFVDGVLEFVIPGRTLQADTDYGIDIDITPLYEGLNRVHQCFEFRAHFRTLDE